MFLILELSHTLYLITFFYYTEDHTFKKTRQLINSTDLNKLLRSLVYPHFGGQLRVAYLILNYSPVYQSFQAVRKAITQNHPLLHFINVSCKGYILSPSECAQREEGRYRSSSPPPFTLADLGVTIVVPTPVDCPWPQRRKKTGNASSRSPSPIDEEPVIQTVIPQEETPAKMLFQRGRVTLSQLLATPIVPRGQAPPNQATTTYATPLVTAVTVTPTHETRAGKKRPRGSSSDQPLTVPDFENSLPDLGDTHVDAIGALAYIKAFMVDEEVLPATNRVRPWRESRGGKVAECVGKALLLPEDMKHWAK